MVQIVGLCVCFPEGCKEREERVGRRFWNFFLVERSFWNKTNNKFSKALFDKKKA